MNSPPPSTPQMFRLTGRIALVTGGCQNLGLEIATGLVEAGASVAVTSRDATKAEAAAARLAKLHGVQTFGVSMDVRDEASVTDGFRRAEEALGPLDIVVNNAGGSTDATGKLETETLASWRAYVDLNLTSAFLCVREAARRMIPRKKGAIVNIASITSLVGRDRTVYDGTSMKNPVAYTASKAGVLGLTYDAAAYLGAHGIRVNAVSPGGFERGQPASFIAAYSARTMQGRMGRDGWDLKGTVLFLVSDAAAYVTGHNLVVDGGFTRFK